MKIENVADFKWDGYKPYDIKYTFLSLTTMIYTHGDEDKVIEYIKCGLKKDKFGNYYKVIGDSNTMFTSHLDNHTSNTININRRFFNKDGDDFYTSDGNSILGADDKAGVVIMLNMIHNSIPGVYYFFIGEEAGGVGSGKIRDNFKDIDCLRGIKKCISFDRRGYDSLIIKQSGKTSCSIDFAKSLLSSFASNGIKLNLDPTGIYTDSYEFIDLIPECTNISVGYFNEHTNKETQNITFLENLCKACCSIKWGDLMYFENK